MLWNFGNNIVISEEPLPYLARGGWLRRCGFERDFDYEQFTYIGIRFAASALNYNLIIGMSINFFEAET